MGAPGERKNGWIIPCILATLQCGALLFAALWLATRPSIFDRYYSLLVRSPSLKDVHEIGLWLNSNQSPQALAPAMSQGQFSEKELAHYADVRAEVRKIPAAFFICASAFFALYIAGLRSNLVQTIQWWAFAIMLIFVCSCIGLAIWDWRMFFRWIHYPLFGSTSWRFPIDSYSLQLFPVGFWRAAGIIVVLPPLLFPCLILAFQTKKARSTS